jgi:acetyltransferase-like isoleucine patch superfamily enzyme
MMRLCGADIGKDVMMAEQQVLPDSLTVGEGSFYASGNCLTSLNIDQGRMLLPCRTVMGERTFMGNHNHIVEGLEEGCFAGLNTWVPKKTGDSDTSFFGNPAMPFKRAGKQQAPPKPSALMNIWFHLSSSCIDVFFWKGLKATVVAVQFCVGRSLFPEITDALQVPCLLGIYIAIPLLAWYLVNVRIGNILHHDRVPSLNDMYSLTVLGWFNSQNAVRAFPNPIKVAGSAWQAPFLWLYGAKIGRHFFSAAENVLWDPPFSRIGDSVTADYDATVKMHTFADFKLKFVEQKIENGAILMHGCAVSSTNVGEGAVLRRGSVTWKGQTLEPGKIYEGAPAEAIDDLEAGRASSGAAAPTLLGRLRGPVSRTAGKQK